MLDNYFWLYLVLIILTGFAVAFTITYKVCEPDASNLWWILLAGAGVIWAGALLALYFKVTRTNMEFLMIRDYAFS